MALALEVMASAGSKQLGNSNNLMLNHKQFDRLSFIEVLYAGYN